MASGRFDSPLFDAYDDILYECDEKSTPYISAHLAQLESTIAGPESEHVLGTLYGETSRVTWSGDKRSPLTVVHRPASEAEILNIRFKAIDSMAMTDEGCPSMSVEDVLRRMPYVKVG